MSATGHDDATMTDQAAYWHTRLRDEDFSETDRTRFEAWLEGDPARRKELDALNALWARLGAVAHSPEVMAERQALAKIARRRRVFQAAGWAIAASVVCGVGALAWRSVAPKTEHYATAIGEQRTVELSDGSKVTLNTASELRVHFTRGERRLDLLAGQASFDVEKDRTRPFIVTAGSGQVRALGTVFDVYKRTDKVVVTLIEGSVAVVPDLNEKAPATDPTIILAAGEQLSFGEKDAAPTRASVDLQQASAWRARKLNFVDTPLNEAIAEANRYSRQKIQLRAPGLQDAKISGVFDAGRNESVAEGLRAYFRLRLTRSGDDLIVLTEPPH